MVRKFVRFVRALKFVPRDEPEPHIWDSCDICRLLLKIKPDTEWVHITNIGVEWAEQSTYTFSFISLALLNITERRNNGVGQYIVLVSSNKLHTGSNLSYKEDKEKGERKDARNYSSDALGCLLNLLEKLPYVYFMFNCLSPSVILLIPFSVSLFLRFLTRLFLPASFLIFLFSLPSSLWRG
jgi:hypothetical protein